MNRAAARRVRIVLANRIQKQERLTAMGRSTLNGALSDSDQNQLIE
ncbi:MAG: hypothetical protein AB8C02_03890 [Halioglobus sp.]